MGIDFGLTTTSMPISTAFGLCFGFIGLLVVGWIVVSIIRFFALKRNYIQYSIDDDMKKYIPFMNQD